MNPGIVAFFGVFFAWSASVLADGPTQAPAVQNEPLQDGSEQGTAPPSWQTFRHEVVSVQQRYSDHVALATGSLIRHQETVYLLTNAHFASRNDAIEVLISDGEQLGKKYPVREIAELGTTWRHFFAFDFSVLPIRAGHEILDKVVIRDLPPLGSSGLRTLSPVDLIGVPLGFGISKLTGIAPTVVRTHVAFVSRIEGKKPPLSSYILPVYLPGGYEGGVVIDSPPEIPGPGEISQHEILRACIMKNTTDSAARLSGAIPGELLNQVLTKALDEEREVETKLTKTVFDDTSEKPAQAGIERGAVPPSWQLFRGEVVALVQPGAQEGAYVNTGSLIRHRNTVYLLSNAVFAQQFHEIEVLYSDGDIGKRIPIREISEPGQTWRHISKYEFSVLPIRRDHEILRQVVIRELPPVGPNSLRTRSPLDLIGVSLGYGVSKATGVTPAVVRTQVANVSLPVAGSSFQEYKYLIPGEVQYEDQGGVLVDPHSGIPETVGNRPGEILRAVVLRNTPNQIGGRYSIAMPGELLNRALSTAIDEEHAGASENPHPTTDEPIPKSLLPESKPSALPAFRREVVALVLPPSPERKCATGSVIRHRGTNFLVTSTEFIKDRAKVYVVFSQGEKQGGYHPLIDINPLGKFWTHFDEIGVSVLPIRDDSDLLREVTIRRLPPVESNSLRTLSPVLLIGIPFQFGVSTHMGVEPTVVQTRLANASCLLEKTNPELHSYLLPVHLPDGFQGGIVVKDPSGNSDTGNSPQDEILNAIIFKNTSETGGKFALAIPGEVLNRYLTKAMDEEMQLP